MRTQASALLMWVMFCCSTIRQVVNSASNLVRCGRKTCNCSKSHSRSALGRVALYWTIIFHCFRILSCSTEMINLALNEHKFRTRLLSPYLEVHDCVLIMSCLDEWNVFLPRLCPMQITGLLCVQTILSIICYLFLVPKWKKNPCLRSLKRRLDSCSIFWCVYSFSLRKPT